MKETPAGTMTVSILAGDVTDPAEVVNARINSITVDDQTDDSMYLPASVSFNSGSNTEVAIYFTNAGVECRIDTFTITVD